MNTGVAAEHIHSLLARYHQEGTEEYNIYHYQTKNDFQNHMCLCIFQTLKEVTDLGYDCPDYLELTEPVKRFVAGLPSDFEKSKEQLLLSLGLHQQTKSESITPSNAQRAERSIRKRKAPKIGQGKLIKMSGFDEFMAMLRTDFYTKDYKKLTEYRKSPQGTDELVTDIKARWRFLFKPFTPDLSHLHGEVKERVRQKISKRFPDVRILNGAISKESYEENAVQWLIEHSDFNLDKFSAFSLVTRYEGRPIGSKRPFKQLKEGCNEKYLYLRIDLDKSQADILNEIKDLVKYAQEFRPKKDKRNKPTGVDPWLAYDIRMKCDNLMEATRVLFDGDESHYREVEFAYKKACRMIKQVENRLR